MVYESIILVVNQLLEVNIITIINTFSGFAVIAIAAFAFMQNHFAKAQAKESEKQTNLMKKEIESRLRPWLSPINIINTLVSFQDESVVSLDDANEQIRTKQNKSKPSSLIYELQVKNFGAIPCEYRIKTINGESKIEKKDLEKRSKISTYTIMPGETKFSHAKLAHDYLKNGGIYYVGILLEYNIDENRISKIGKIWKIDYKSTDCTSEWIDDPDLTTKNNV